MSPSATSVPISASKPAQILAQTAFFGELDAAQIDRVAGLTAMQDFASGQQVYRIGEPARSVYVLLSGTVRMAIAYGNRNASAGDVLRRGEVFGWAALTPRCNLRIATATCVSPCRMLAVDGAGLLRLMAEDHSLGYFTMKQLTQLITGPLTAFAGG